MLKSELNTPEKFGRIRLTCSQTGDSPDALGSIIHNCLEELDETPYPD